MIDHYLPQLLLAWSIQWMGVLSPGPSVMLILSVATSRGRAPSLVTAFGIACGTIILATATVLGLASIFARFAEMMTAIRLIGAAYLLWLAWKIATARGLGTREGSGRPMSFAQAVAFQAVNPKGWAMALSTVSAYVPQRGFLANLGLTLAVFSAITVCSVSTWTAGGVALRRLLDRPAALRAFNVGMALLLAASLWPILAE